MRRAFYLTFSEPSWVEVAKRLAAEGVARPVYWTGLAAIGEAVAEAFPGVVFHERFAAARGVPPAACADLDLQPLDKDLLEALAYHESITLKMMERMDIGDSFSYQDRVRLYHDQLRYWSTLMDRLEPDVVIFYSSPHFVYDYVCYALCRLRGIDTIVFKGTSLPGWSVAAESLEGIPSRLARAYDGELGLEPLSPGTEAYLASLLGDYAEAVPDYMKTQASWERTASWGSVLARLKDVRSYPRQAARLLDLGVKGWKATWRRKPAHTVTKRRSRPTHEPPSVLAYTLLKLAAGARQRRLKAYYRSLSRPLDLAQPYVFCALHMQPERTTSPDGGVYAHQYLMVELLASALPTGWRLYVKEHVSQFVSERAFDSSLAQSRSASFYHRLAALPNVSLAPVELAPFPLIDGARAVATVTGTVGWEAVNRGKPTLAFGYPWYLGCEGVFATPTLRQLRQALDAVAGGYQVDEARVRRFAAAIEAVGFKAYQYDGVARTALLSEDEFATICSEAVRRHLKGGWRGPKHAAEPASVPATEHS